MARRLASVAFLAPDYDSAIAWFCQALGFELIEDSDLGAGKRWVVVAPDRHAGARIVIAKAADARQLAAVGEAAGGRVAYFLETDDFFRDHEAFIAARESNSSKRRAANPMGPSPSSPTPSATSGT